MDHYSLSGILHGHKSDVRSITTSFDGNFIATVSRDTICKLWRLENSGEYYNYISFSYGNKYALVVKYLKYKEKEVIAIGGLDFTIQIRDITEGKLIGTIVGHSNGVSCIDIYEGNILTGSWDCSLKLWNLNFNEIRSYNYHSAAVWCVLVVETGFLSGSADFSIVYWLNNLPEKSLIGHSGPVREIIKLNYQDQICSCSNDGSIRVWGLKTGQCQRVIRENGPYIYSLTPVSGYYFAFVSSGEENSVKVYRDFELSNEIIVPSTSNWCVRCLPNTDILVGSSSNVVFIFTRNPNRVASKEINEEFHSLLNETLKSGSFGPDIDVSTLKTVEEGTKDPGTHDGQTKMLRQGQSIVIYEWSVEQNSWVFIGDALRQVHDDEKQGLKIRYEGNEYDHVIDVELENGRKYKLPFNNGENPYDIARIFTSKNSLPDNFHQQIVDFLITNVPQAFKSENNLNQTSQGSLNKKPILFKTTNIPGLFSRLKLNKTVKEEDIENLRKYVEISVNDINPSLDKTNFPFQTVNLLLLCGEDFLLPTLDLIKQLVLYEEFFVEFFLQHNNTFHFILIEFLNNFTKEGINAKCQMLAIRVGVNALSHKNHLTHFIAQLPHFNTILFSVSLWTEQQNHLSLASLMFNLSILLLSHKDQNKEIFTEFFSNSVWIIEAFNQCFDSETLLRLFSTLENLFVLPCFVDFPPSSLASLSTIFNSLQSPPPKLKSIISNIQQKLSKF